MRNPQITAKLHELMQEEKKVKIQVIGCIMDNYKETSPQIFNYDTFCALYELDFYALNVILDNLINEMTANINYQLERLKQRN